MHYFINKKSINCYKKKFENEDIIFKKNEPLKTLFRISVEKINIKHLKVFLAILCTVKLTVVLKLFFIVFFYFLNHDLLLLQEQ